MAYCSKKNAALVVGAIFALFYVYQKRQVFLGIAAVLAFALAFTLLLLPLNLRLEKRGMSSSAAALCSVLTLMVLVVILVSAFIPYLAAHTVDLVRRITPTLNSLLKQGGALLEQFGLNGISTSGLPEMIASSMSRVTSIVARGGMTLASQAGKIVFSLVIAYYLLCEKWVLGNHLLLCIPLEWRGVVLSGLRSCKNAILSYLSGLLKTSLFVGAATFAGLLLLGIRDALLLSVFMGVFEILPYIGPVLAAVPILLTALTQGMSRAILALLLVVLVQQVEGNIVSPYFAAASTSIHPLAALLSVFVFGSLLGIWGILLAIPFVVTMRCVLWSARQAELPIGS